MELISADDAVFVIDLSPLEMERCRADFSAEASGDPVERSLPQPPERPIRAIALLFARDDEPALLVVPPTRDVRMLDALARLLRGAMLSGLSVAELAMQHGDDELRRMYSEGAFPGFLYSGVPRPMRDRFPAELARALPAVP